jgi:hypothetical protein
MISIALCIHLVINDLVNNSAQCLLEDKLINSSLTGIEETKTYILSIIRIDHFNRKEKILPFPKRRAWSEILTTNSQLIQHNNQSTQYFFA